MNKETYSTIEDSTIEEAEIAFSHTPAYFERIKTYVEIVGERTDETDWRYCFGCSHFVPEGHTCQKETAA